MEFVLVVPRAELFPECYPQGFVPFGPELSLERFEALASSRGYFVERAHAERTPSLKQVIPYSIIVRGADVARGAEVFLLRRLAKGGESRLIDKLSIGVGGHLEPQDARAARSAVLQSGARREIEEELEIAGPIEPRPIGILNDDSNPVGAVHVGVVQIVTVSGSVRVREAEVLEGRFVRSSELADMLAAGANFESWSARLVERLDALLLDHGRARTPSAAPASLPVTP